MQTRGDRDRSRGERTPLDHSEVEARETIERTGEPERYAGYCLLDPRGQRIGRVEVIFTSGGGEPQYVRVTISRYPKCDSARRSMAGKVS